MTDERNKTSATDATDRRPTTVIEGTATEIPPEAKEAAAAPDGDPSEPRPDGRAELIEPSDPADEEEAGAKDAAPAPSLHGDFPDDDLKVDPDAPDPDRDLDLDHSPDSDLDRYLDRDLASALPPRMPDAAPSAARRSGGFFSHMTAGLLGAALGVLVAGAAWPFIEQALGLSKSEDQIFRMESRVAKLEAAAVPVEGAPSTADFDAIVEGKIASLREQVAALEPTAEGGMAEQIGALSARIDALSQAEQPAEGAPTIAELAARVTELEGKMPDVAAKVTAQAAESRTAALAVAVANLRTAVNSGRPFENELAIVKTVGKGGLELSGLEARAANGAPTQADLQQRFTASSNAALRAEAKSDADQQSWGGRLLDNAKSLVKVRKDGEPEGAGGSDSAAKLARARDWMQGGDLVQAVGEVEGLGGSAAGAMSGWLNSARGRLAADDALARLQRAAVGQTGATAPAQRR